MELIDNLITEQSACKFITNGSYRKKLNMKNTDEDSATPCNSLINSPIPSFFQAENAASARNLYPQTDNNDRDIHDDIHNIIHNR
jgi:hypothetical protein